MTDELQQNFEAFLTTQFHWDHVIPHRISFRLGLSFNRKRIVNEKEGNTIHDARKTSRGGEGKKIKTESVKGPPGPLTDVFFKKGDPFSKLGQLLGRQKASQMGVELKRKRLNSIAKAPKDGMKTPADDSNNNLGENVEARLVRNDWAN